MANYAGANRAKGQAHLIKKFDEEARKSINPVTYLKFVENTEIMVPSHKELRLREDRTIESYTFARSKRGTGVGRSHNHTGVKGDNLTLSPSFTTRNDVFKTSIKQSDNSVFTLQDEFNNEMENAVKNVLDDQEGFAIDYTFNNRSQVNVGNAVEGAWDATDFVYKITESTFGDQAPQITKTIMRENLLTGSYIIFCDSLAFDKFEFKFAQGAGNATNLSFQSGNLTFVQSIGLDDGTRFGSLVGTYNKGVWVAVPVGDIAHLDWIPKQNREGLNTKIQQYSTVINPIDGLEYALHDYATAADDSANNGYTQDEVTQYELSIDSSFQHAPLTTANETPLQAFALV